MNAPRGESKLLTDEEAAREMARRTRRSFLVGGAAALAGAAGIGWAATRPAERGLAWPFRRILEFNEKVVQAALPPRGLAPTFPPERIQPIRVNGRVGLDEDFRLADGKIEVRKDEPGARPLRLSLEEVRGLPKIDLVVEHKCIEGWSTVVQWTGARFSDFARRFQLLSDSSGKPFPYVSLSTPGGGYYVGMDIASALHPQTLLTYRLNGEDLSPEHGAPLRLSCTVKYGVKAIKRIGAIVLTHQRPADYWAERGYDWYAGL